MDSVGDNWPEMSKDFFYPWTKSARLLGGRNTLENRFHSQWKLLEVAESMIGNRYLYVEEAIRIIFDLGLPVDSPKYEESKLMRDTHLDNMFAAYMQRSIDRRTRGSAQIFGVEIYRYLMDLVNRGYDKFLYATNEWIDGSSATEFPSYEEPRPVTVYKHIFKPREYWPLLSYDGSLIEEGEDGVIILHDLVPSKMLIAFKKPPERVFFGTCYFTNGILYKEKNGELVDISNTTYNETLFHVGVGSYPGVGVTFQDVL